MQASASRTNNLISEVLLPDSANKAIYQTFENLARQDAYRLTFSAPFTITKWWRSNNNISGIHLHTRSQHLKGQDLDAGRFFVMANTNNSFQLGKGLTAELTGRYTSTLVYSTIQLQPVYSFDIGFAKTVLANKGTVRLSVVDAFNTLDQNVQSVYPGFKYDLFQKVESRIVRLGFTYRFGNSQVKASRNRTTGVETEQNRLQKGVQ